MNRCVTALWRYPVSSMGGERLERAPVTASGIIGDRIWGLVDAASERIAWPGRDPHFARVPKGHARLADGSVAISADGERWTSPDDGKTLSDLSQLFGFAPVLRPFAPSEADGFRPRYVRAPIHLLTSAAMRNLRQDLPGSVIDERRFRPNIVVDWPDGELPIPEHDWIGREIRIGEVVLRGTRLCARCGFTTLEQEGLPLDVEVLRTVLRRHERNFGLYCDVLSAGEIAPGDPVTVAGISP